MCGSATLAIVVSSPYMMFANMIEKVIAPRFGPGARALPFTAKPRGRERRSAEFRICAKEPSESRCGQKTVILMIGPAIKRQNQRCHPVLPEVGARRSALCGGDIPNTTRYAVVSTGA